MTRVEEIKAMHAAIDAKVLNLWSDHTVRQIAAVVDRSIRAVQGRAVRLGLGYRQADALPINNKGD